MEPPAARAGVVKTVLATVVALAALAVLGGAAFVYSGAYNVAASDEHWPVVYRLMETARVRSIQAHAKGIAVPAGYDSQERIVSAVGHFSMHCATCHGAPGTKRGEFAEGMYPQPPNLTDVSKRYTPAELFWILKNGIKMSGMPPMADDGDELLWSTVGFLEKLPTMSEDDFSDLWMAAQAQGGHEHMMNMGGMNMQGMDRPSMNMERRGQAGSAPPEGSPPANTGPDKQ